MIGKFEELYRNVPDPWEQEKVVSQAEIYALFCIDSLRNIDTVIDLGCGTGRFTSEIAKLTEAKTFGFDISQTAIEKAKNKYGGSVEFQQMELPTLTFDDNSVNLVVCSQLFWYVF